MQKKTNERNKHTQILKKKHEREPVSAFGPGPREGAWGPGRSFKPQGPGQRLWAMSHGPRAGYNAKNEPKKLLTKR